MSLPAPSIARALWLASFSAASTLIGAVIVIARGQAGPLNAAHLAFTCGLASSVMVFVSWKEMIEPAANDSAVGLAQALSIAAVAMVVTGVLVHAAPINALIAMCGLERDDSAAKPRSVTDADTDDSAELVLMIRPHSPVRSRSLAGVKSGPSSPGLSIQSPSHSQTQSATIANQSRLRTLRLGLISAIIQAIHNAPEGLSVVLSSADAEDNSGGLILALAMAAHNAVEGLLVAAPIYAATQSVRLTVGMTAMSCVSELLASVLALALLSHLLTSAFIHRVLSGVSGVMLAVVLVELFPAGLAYQRPKQLVQGATVGVVFMTVTHIAVKALNK